MTTPTRTAPPNPPSNNDSASTTPTNRRKVSDPLPEWVDNLGYGIRILFAVLDSIFEAAGLSLPKTTAKLGLIVFRSIDWILTPINLAWYGGVAAALFGDGNNEWLWLGITAGSMIGIALNYVNYLISQGLVKGAVWAKKISPGLIALLGMWLVINLADGVFDSIWPFIVVGETSIITSPGFDGWMNALRGLGFIMQIAVFLTIGLSMFSDLFAAYIEFKEESEKKTSSKAAPAEAAPAEAAPAEDPNFPEEFHITFDPAVHKAITHPKATDRRVIFAKDAKQDAKPLGWCFANELSAKQTPPPPPPQSPVTTH